MKRLKKNPFIGVAILSGIGIIGWIDYKTGIELRIYPLYFLPLIAAAWMFGMIGAISLSILASIVWFSTIYESGHYYSHPSIWIINFITQFCTFLIVSTLVADLRDTLTRERALSRIDLLTGLANIRSFYEQAEGLRALCQRNSKPITLAYLDLDNFKQVNDTFGHQQGDILLQKVALLMKEQLRSSDIPARIGGDEFILLLPETSKEEAQIVLERLRAQLVQSPLFQKSQVTASIGAISYENIPATLEEMIKEADTLMYQAKTIKNTIRVENKSPRAVSLAGKG